MAILNTFGVQTIPFWHIRAASAPTGGHFEHVWSPNHSFLAFLGKQGKPARRNNFRKVFLGIGLQSKPARRNTFRKVFLSMGLDFARGRQKNAFSLLTYRWGSVFVDSASTARLLQSVSFWLILIACHWVPCLVAGPSILVASIFFFLRAGA